MMFWVNRKPRHGWLACSVAAALAALMACWPARSSAEPLHFLAAQVLSIEGNGFSAPPYLLEAANPQGDWRPVSLPHAVPPELLPGVDDPLRPRTVVTWYRLQVPRQQGAADALNPYYLYIPRWKTDGQLAVYASGRLVYRSSGNLLWNGSNHPLWIRAGQDPERRAAGQHLAKDRAPARHGRGRLQRLAGPAGRDRLALPDA